MPVEHKTIRLYGTKTADVHVIYTDSPWQALSKDLATNVCLNTKIEAHSDCHSSAESWAEMSLSTADVFVQIEKHRICVCVCIQYMYVYIYILYYRATWNMAMGNVILFRADGLAITIIKKAFIIILSNPRRRQTEVDPIPTSPSLESLVLNSIPVREWPNPTPTCRYLKSTVIPSPVRRWQSATEGARKTGAINTHIKRHSPFSIFSSTFAVRHWGRELPGGVSWRTEDAPRHCHWVWIMSAQ